MSPDERKRELDRLYHRRSARKRRGERLELIYRLDVAHLAHFVTPKPWSAITELRPLLGPRHWRAGIVDAENRGLLRWVRARAMQGPKGAWMLTDRGRELVERDRR